jgi:HSP20 family protein
MPPPQDDSPRRVQRDLERLFHDLVYHRHPTSHFAEPMWHPATDVIVLEDSARILIELAGVSREQVQVRLLGRLLEITGRRDPPQQPGVAHYHRAEISFGEFRRTIELPWEADADSVDARVVDGMLEIHLNAAPAARRTIVTIEHRSE